ncbi:hypothetical protein F2Q69_00029439 [Brassica cretica]|uniref:Uncharacterized protein n=1 Tax=Brassica cretica TaxID=69181 RepID=A0A8S9RWN7_BRACR|nr:hypothetical protein F2Q69_00029439 [Brassica cretica]
MSSSISLVSLKNIHNLWVLPVGTLSPSIGSSPSSEGVLTVSGGFLKSWVDVGVLLRTPRESESSRHWKMRLTPMVSSVDALEILSIDLDWATSIDIRSLASIDVRSLASINAIR